MEGSDRRNDRLTLPILPRLTASAGRRLLAMVRGPMSVPVPPTPLLQRQAQEKCMHCPLCQRPIDPSRDRVVQTRGGGPVHVVCADRDARRARRECAAQAIGHAAVILLTLALWIRQGLPPRIVLVLVASNILVHLLTHAHWWQHILRHWRG